MPEVQEKPQILVGRDDLIGPWVCEQTGGSWHTGLGTTIGLVRDGKLVAGVLYEGWNGASLQMHVASDGSRRWMNREYLWFCFWYPFEQIKVRRINGIVPASNAAARRFDEHLGFVLEATLKDAHPDGDLLLYRMFRHECRWLRRNHAHAEHVYPKAA